MDLSATTPLWRQLLELEQLIETANSAENPDTKAITSAIFQLLKDTESVELTVKMLEVKSRERVLEHSSRYIH